MQDSAVLGNSADNTFGQARNPIEPVLCAKKRRGGERMSINAVGPGTSSTQAAKQVLESSTAAPGVQKKGHKHHHGGHHKVVPEQSGQNVDTAQISDKAKELASSATVQSGANNSKPTT